MKYIFTGTWAGWDSFRQSQIIDWTGKTMEPEHFFDVLSVENELIYGKVRAGYDMRFEGLLLSAMNILFYIRPVYFSTSFFLSGNDWSYLQASGYKENGSNRLFSLSEISVLYLDRFLFLLPGLSFSPWLSIYWWIVSTGAIFQRFLLFSLTSYCPASFCHIS